MKAQDVTDTLDIALAASGCDQARIIHKPRLLSDNGSSYVSSGPAEWLDAQDMGHVRGAPYHPQTQGKIERWHQTPFAAPAVSGRREDLAGRLTRSNSKFASCARSSLIRLCRYPRSSSVSCVAS